MRDIFLIEKFIRFAARIIKLNHHLVRDKKRSLQNNGYILALLFPIPIRKNNFCLCSQHFFRRRFGWISKTAPFMHLFR